MRQYPWMNAAQSFRRSRIVSIDVVRELPLGKWVQNYRAGQDRVYSVILRERKAEVIRRVQGPSGSVVVPHVEGSKQSWGLEIPSFHFSTLQVVVQTSQGRRIP